MAETEKPFDFNGTGPLPTTGHYASTASTASAANARPLRPSTTADDEDHEPQPSGTPTTSSHPLQPVVDAQGRILNPRSCVTCRRRKVKCDKLHPCSNCSRAHIDCIFPTPGRAPRKVRKSTDGRDAELLARLRRLEGVVKGLGVDVGPDQAADAAHPVPDTFSPTQTQQADGGERDPGGAEYTADGNGNSAEPHSRSANSSMSQSESAQQKAQWIEQAKSGRFEGRFGRLVINEGRSRYVNNSFWANLSNEVEDLKGILNQDSDDDADPASPSSGTQPPGHHHGWVFNFSSQSVDLLALHPIPMQIETYWQVFKERVDPLVKVLHIPSIEPTILAASSHLANLAKGFEALLFAIYYGAATSLTPEDCLAKLGEERGVLLSRYRFAIEQALARANFLTTEEIVVLQAFVIFLICLRRNNDARVIWTLTGLIVRMAQTLGIHRDGLHFGLSPFEIETRRRLWWQVCILDVRASEDHGCDPTIIEQQFDTKMPLNINDADIDPSSTDLPPERRGCTDMSFCLIRFEVANTFRRLNYVPPGQKGMTDSPAVVSMQDKEHWIQECHDRLETKYLSQCDVTVPIFWVTATVARLMMSKMWLMAYHPFQRQGGGAALPDEVRNKLFIASLENMEYAHLLETEARTMKWGWLFKTYMQWHALAFVLSELCHRTRGELVERAWVAVDKTRWGHWTEIGDYGRRGHLWKPLNRIIAKASAARQQAVREDEAAAAASSQQQRRASLTQQSQKHLPGSTAELLEAMKQRPRLVSAPLSQAQVARFMSSPSPATYGTQPVDSTKLLQSPVLQNANGEQMDMPDLLREPLPAPRAIGNGSASHTTNTPSQSWPRPSASTPSVPWNNGAFGYTNAPTTTASPQNMGSGADVSMSFDNPGAGDADIDWANWDQLVRQFGMDMDSTQTPGTVGAGPSNVNQAGSAAWGNGAGWGTLNNGLGMGMGMGGSDWF